MTKEEYRCLVLLIKMELAEVRSRLLLFPGLTERFWNLDEPDLPLGLGNITHAPPFTSPCFSLAEKWINSPRVSAKANASSGAQWVST